MNTPALQAKAASTPEGSGVEFGRSADDMPVARVGDLVFATVPGRDGQHFLASAWRVSRPSSELKRYDFYSHHGAVADEAEFRARMFEQAEHVPRPLGARPADCPDELLHPWGPSQGATVYAEGIVSHTTAGHGGFKLSNDRNGKIHVMLRCAGGWYDKGAAWAAVALAYPEHLYEIRAQVRRSDDPGFLARCLGIDFRPNPTRRIAAPLSASMPATGSSSPRYAQITNPA
jgi:hypothetical protein